MTENLDYHNYVILEEKQSQIDTDATIYIKVCMKCPRCKTRMPLIEHGETAKCQSCRLIMTVYGNCITCKI